MPLTPFGIVSETGAVHPWKGVLDIAALPLIARDQYCTGVGVKEMKGTTMMPRF